MKPRRRMALKNHHASPPEPQWSGVDIDYMVDRALYMLRNLRMDQAEKERLVRAYLRGDEGLKST